MPNSIPTRSCTEPTHTCTGICTGYESTGTCPPLIVLAVLANTPSPASPKPSARADQ